MARISQKTNSVPAGLEQIFHQLGQQIRIARKRRRLSMQEMAERMFVTRQTLARLEKGEGGVTIAVLAAALWVLGLEKQLLVMADPAHDNAGLFMEKQHLPQRIRKTTNRDELDF